jgi:hypothetical protein
MKYVTQSNSYNVSNSTLNLGSSMAVLNRENASIKANLSPCLMKLYNDWMDSGGKDPHTQC